MKQNLLNAISDCLGRITGQAVSIDKTTSIGGGCINDAFCLETNAGKFFLKINSSQKFTGMFEAEEKGLNLLRSAGCLGIPRVFRTGGSEGISFFIAEFIEGSSRTSDFSWDFGRSLARLHKNTAEFFGLDHENYIGSLPQSNRQHKTWIDFFIAERLEKQVKLARDHRKIDGALHSGFERLYKKLRDLFPVEPSSLLHGDLWSGNCITGPNGKAWLIDPAVYYGFREMDLAMTRLFGGFDPEFYEAYNEEFPLEKNWQQRIDICNLYPLMVHVNLFGGGYLPEVKKIVKKIE